MCTGGRVAVSLALLMACASNESEGDGSHEQYQLGPDGGSIVFAEGVQIEVPPGALADTTIFTIGPEPPPTLPGGATPVGPAFALGPSGITFAMPATITFPFDPALVPTGATVAVYRAADASLEFHALTTNVVDDESSVATTELSTWVPAAIGPCAAVTCQGGAEACGCTAMIDGTLYEFVCPISGEPCACRQAGEILGSAPGSCTEPDGLASGYFSCDFPCG